MKRRKKIRVLANKKIIFLSLIISMSFVGVGYAQWDDSLTIDLSIKTGFICRDFDLDSYKSFDDGDLYFSVSDDGSTLYIKGKVYPTFNESLTINLVDNGSLPSIITNVYTEDNNISTIMNSADKQKRTYSNTFSKNPDSFTINIRPEINKDSINTMKSTVNFEKKDDISNLVNTIANIDDEKSLYDNIEKQSFKYIISYELGNGIWKKDLIVEGNIDIVPDPEILNSMNLKLNELQNQLKEKYEEEKLRLIEEQRLLDEQKKSEQDNIEQTPQEENEIIEENTNNDETNEENSSNIPEIEKDVVDDKIDESDNNDEKKSNNEDEQNVETSETPEIEKDVVDDVKDESDNIDNDSVEVNNENQENLESEKTE